MSTAATLGLESPLMPGPSQQPNSTDSQQESRPRREVRFEHSHDLAEILGGLQASLIVSTYQAGKLAVLGSAEQKLSLSFHNFDRPMGVAIHPRGDRMAVASRNKVWFLRNDREVASQLEPPGAHEACFLTRSAHVTGDIQAHEMGWNGQELWLVNTLFSCLCTLAPDYSFVPRWRPPFISQLAAEDRCHLNGMAMHGDKARYVTMMGQTDSAGGWRPNKAKSGCLMDVDSGEVIAEGFAMPHSPRAHLGQIWLLDSGRGSLVRVDPASGETVTVARFPGYTRGLAMIGGLAFVGLSKIRETSTFGGVPIAEDPARLKCGVGVVDIQRGTLVGQFEFTSGVDEIFDVSLVTGARSTAMRGPFADEDGDPTIWTAPALNDINSLKF